MKFVCPINELYNALCLNKEYLINILRKHAPELCRGNDDDFLYEFENYSYTSERKINDICKSFINEFEQAPFIGARFKIDAEKMTHSGGYELPPTCDSIQSIADFPSLAQIVNNHFKIHLNFDINFFSSISKFKPLLIRNDNIALVLIHDITSDQMICEPPNHELPGLRLTTINTHPFTNSKYMSLCIVNLNNEWIKKGVYNDINEFCDEENDITKQSNLCNEKYTLLIYAGFYC